MFYVGITMVYIESNEEKITIPRHTFEEYEAYTMTLASNMFNPTTIVDGMGNISANTYYYEFLVEIPTTLPIGEYQYTLTNASGEVLELGLLTYGNFDKVGMVSNNASNQKIQYNGKAK